MAVAFKNDYVQMDEEYIDQTYKMCANTLLTWPSDIDASRLYMNTSETIQSLSMLNPDIPRLSTGWENVLGKLNEGKAFKTLKGPWQVVDIVRKFHNGNIYTLILRNQDTGVWDMIEKPIAEDLQEKFGYVYNTERMDSLKVGDVIQDEVLYKSTAYDDHMNYRYGKEAKVYYSTSTDTLEDAVKIRKGWAEQIQTVEVDSFVVSVNMNHIPLNIYGDKKNYKVCPDFGEPVKGSCVFAMRPRNNKHFLSEGQTEALMQINPSTDLDYYISEAKMSYIYDIDIFYNSTDPFPDTVFFKQLKGYYDEICIYNDRLRKWATDIKESGDPYTDNIPFFKSIYQHANDPDWLWCGKEKNKPFGYMNIRFKVLSILGVVPGSKMAGRYGKIHFYCRNKMILIIGKLI